MGFCINSVSVKNVVNKLAVEFGPLRHIEMQIFKSAPTTYPYLIADTQSHSQSTCSYHTPAYNEDFCKKNFRFFAFVWRVNLSRLRPISTRFTSKRERLPPLKSPILRMKGKESNSKASKLKPSVAFNYDCQSLSYYSISYNVWD